MSVLKLADYRVEPGEWRKGAPRNDVTASRCVHLQVGTWAPTAPMQRPGVLNPDGSPRVQQMLMAPIEVIFQCFSEQHREHWAAKIDSDAAGMGIGDQIRQLKAIRTSLSVCRFCPFYEREQ